MENSHEAQETDLSAEHTLEGYDSMMLQLYTKNLAGRNQEFQILDMGPICEENILYFSQRVKRFHICDMFIRMDRSRREGKSISTIWDHLDYPAQSFQGIHLWDLIEHLNDRDVVKLVELCQIMLKPKGMLMVISFEEQLSRSLINSFVVQDKYHISMRPQSHLDLPWYYRSNRELTLLFAKFSGVKSFLYRNQIREFLFQLEKQSSPLLNDI
jgi:hypothetical protein